MKEPWKKQDNNVKLLMNAEEGEDIPTNIELPISVFTSNSNSCSKRLLTTLKLFILLSLLLVSIYFIALTIWPGFNTYFFYSSQPSLQNTLTTEKSMIIQMNKESNEEKIQESMINKLDEKIKRWEDLNGRIKQMQLILLQNKQILRDQITNIKTLDENAIEEYVKFYEDTAVSNMFSGIIEKFEKDNAKIRNNILESIDKSDEDEDILEMYLLILKNLPQDNQNSFEEAKNTPLVEVNQDSIKRSKETEESMEKNSFQKEDEVTDISDPSKENDEKEEELISSSNEFSTSTESEDEEKDDNEMKEKESITNIIPTDDFLKVILNPIIFEEKDMKLKVKEIKEFSSEKSEDGKYNNENKEEIETTTKPISSNILKETSSVVESKEIEKEPEIMIKTNVTGTKKTYLEETTNHSQEKLNVQETTKFVNLKDYSDSNNQESETETKKTQTFSNESTETEDSNSDKTKELYLEEEGGLFDRQTFDWYFDSFNKPNVSEELLQKVKNRLAIIFCTKLVYADAKLYKNMSYEELNEIYSMYKDISRRISIMLDISENLTKDIYEIERQLMNLGKGENRRSNEYIETNESEEEYDGNYDNFDV